MIYRGLSSLCQGWSREDLTGQLGYEPDRDQFQFHHCADRVSTTHYATNTSPLCFQVYTSGNLCARTPSCYRHPCRLIVVPPRLQNGLMK